MPSLTDKARFVPNLRSDQVIEFRAVGAKRNSTDVEGVERRTPGSAVNSVNGNLSSPLSGL